MSTRDVPVIRVPIRQDFDAWTAAVQAAVVFAVHGVSIHDWLTVRKEYDDVDALAPLPIHDLLRQWPPLASQLGAREEPDLILADGRVWANETADSSFWHICLEEWRIKETRFVTIMGGWND